MGQKQMANNSMEGVQVSIFTHIFFGCSTDPYYETSFGQMFCTLSQITHLSMYPYYIPEGQGDKLTAKLGGSSSLQNQYS